MTLRLDLDKFADKDLQCAACGDGFVFSAGEQELYRLRGIAQAPERCPRCTRGRLLSPQTSNKR
jgi:ribosomal protein S27AE